MRDPTVRRLSRLHTILYRLSGGRIGTRLVDNDMLLLTTTGRVTGEPHTVPLLYLTDADDLVVIASYGGRDYSPEWYLNLLEEPLVEVQVRGGRRAMRAVTMGAEERAVWWPRVVEAYDGYQEYQSRTDREIPVVRLVSR